jgi:outer membrane protein
MRKISLVSFLVILSLGTSSASAQQSPWKLGARVVYFDARNASDPLYASGAQDRLTVEKKELPEIDITYYFSPIVSAELALTNPQKHDIYLDGGHIGSIRQRPSTLNVKMNFNPEALINPYLGLGINYTHFSSARLLNNTGRLDSSSIGWSIQGGLDLKLTSNWSMNVDLRKTRKQSDLMVNGQKASAIQFDPWLFGLGLAYRF